MTIPSLILAGCARAPEGRGDAVIDLGTGNAAIDMPPMSSMLDAVVVAVDQAAMAACFNVFDWKTDRSLDLSILVGTSQHFARAVELIEAGDYSAEEVTQFERDLLDSKTASEAEDNARAAKYWEDVILPAAPEAASSVVVFVVRFKLDAARLVVLDQRTLSAAALAKAQGDAARTTTMRMDGEPVDVDCRKTAAERP